MEPYSVFSEGGQMVEQFKIEVEKELCQLLGKPWSATVSIASLIAEIKERLEK